MVLKKMMTEFYSKYEAKQFASLTSTSHIMLEDEDIKWGKLE